MQVTAELIVKGKIYTADAEGRFAEAMAICGGKIIAVGTAAEVEKLAGENTVVLEKDGLVIPGMTEGHAHISCSTEMVFGVALDHGEDVQDYLDRIKAYMDAHPDEAVIVGSGYDNSLFGEGGPRAAMLDTLSTEKPILMIASDHHSRWVNTKALKLMGIENGSDVHGVISDADGKPTGWLQEAGMSLTKAIVAPYTEADYATAIDYYQNLAFENGITIAFEPIFDASHDYEVRARGYKYLEEKGGLKLTVRLGYTIDPTTGMENDFAGMLRAREELKDCKNVKLTTAKFFVDGVVECHTAYLREDYSNTPGDKGVPLTSQEQMDTFVLRALREGFDVHTHVIGDGASDIALNAYVKAQNTAAAETGRRDFRNALTHLQLLWPDQIKRMADNNVLAVINPYWHTFNPIYYQELELPYLGEERAAKEYPAKGILDAGVHVSQASDFPVTVPPRSMDSLHIMVNRIEPDKENEFAAHNPTECLSVREALDILTIGGAYQLRLEDRKGSLEVGKDADFVVLTDDVFEMPKENLFRCNVAETWIAGEKVWNM